MEFEAYLRDIEALLVHLAPEARVLSEMDLHLVGTLHEEGIPPEIPLAGIRKGVARLERENLKRETKKKPPLGITLTRMRRDIDREVKRINRRQQATPGPRVGDAQPPEGTEPDARWRVVLLRLADEVEGPTRDALRDLSADPGLGEERGFLRFTEITRDFYQGIVEALDPATREQVRGEVARAAAEAHRHISDDARENLVAELVRRRMIAENPILDPRRFWEEE